MNAFWVTLLVQAIKVMIGSVAWAEVLNAVESLLNADFPGEEKRRLAREQIRRAVENVPNRLLNLAIEIAVAKMTPR
jgi:hypothetical protein